MVFGLRTAPDRRERRDRGWFTALPELLLEGLSVVDARALLATAGPGLLDDGVRDRIIAETAGNPLALLELAAWDEPGRSCAAGSGCRSRAGSPPKVEERYVRRVRQLPETTQQLMLLAAAEAVGRRVPRSGVPRPPLGIGPDAAAPGASAELLEIGGQRPGSITRWSARRCYRAAAVSGPAGRT
jgi:hypothetical protein